MTSASSSAVPRGSFRTILGYDDVVTASSPSVEDTMSVSASSQSTPPLAAGSAKPPSSGAMNARSSTSYSRSATASPPSGERRTMQRRQDVPSSGRRKPAPAQTHSVASSAASASTSSTISHSGESLT